MESALDLSDVPFDLFLKAAKSGNWALLAAVVVMLLVVLARKLGAKKFPWLAGDAAGVALAFVMSAAGVLATALAADSPMSWALMLGALKIAWSAMGGYVAAKKLLLPLLRKVPYLGALLPAASDPAVVVAEAEKAGADAVAAKPSTGVSGVLGEPKDVP